MSLIDAIHIGVPLSIVLGAGIIIVLERFYPYNVGQKLFRKGFAIDLFWYTLAQSYLLGLLISYLITSLENALPIYGLNGIRHLPLFGQVVLFTVAHDFYIYWFHRLQHNVEFLWRIHEAHHSNVEVDWLSGSRSHPLEILVNQSIEYVPIVLFGSPEVALIKGAIDAVWGMYIHSNINVRSGLLQRIINGPEMHRWHHAIDNDAHNKNFSTKLAIWDWLFGTAYLPAHDKPTGYGLGSPFPTTVLQQILVAFRKP